MCVYVYPCQGTCLSPWLKLFLDSVGGWCQAILSWWSEVVWVFLVMSETSAC